jgi:16S rRNA (guanine966-N2)-methyltransferase
VRVIAGSAKGTRLARVPSGVRPLSDRAREGVFASLAGRVPGAACLDLFAGTGAVGIEALSRGAGSATLVDSSPAAVRAIRDNLARTGLGDRATVVRQDAARYLAAPQGPFDLAFLDPPYAHPRGALSSLLQALRESVEPGAAVALTRPSSSSTDVIPVYWRVARLLEYGDTHVLVLEEA